jgi:hypothetical protein
MGAGGLTMERLGDLGTIALCAMAVACGEPTRPSPPEPAASVVVEDLVLEARDPEGAVDLVVRADRAFFDDVPGRGAGRLVGVEVEVGESAPGPGARGRITARARRGALGRDGALALEGARVALGGGGAVTLTVEAARIGPGREVHGEGVRATLRPPAGEESP